jgi:hypothetical protein
VGWHTRYQNIKLHLKYGTGRCLTYEMLLPKIMTIVPDGPVLDQYTIQNEDPFHVLNI